MEVGAYDSQSVKLSELRLRQFYLDFPRLPADVLADLAGVDGLDDALVDAAALDEVVLREVSDCFEAGFLIRLSGDFASVDVRARCSFCLLSERAVAAVVDGFDEGGFLVCLAAPAPGLSPAFSVVFSSPDAFAVYTRLITR